MKYSVAGQQRDLGDVHTTTLTTTTNLALLLSNTGQHAEAEALGRSALTQANRTLEADHPTSLEVTRALAIVLGGQGQAA